MNPLSKDELRRQAAQLRDSISATRRSEAVNNALNRLPKSFPNQGFVLSYAPFNSELDISGINSSLALSHRLVLPKVTKNYLELYLVEDLDSSLEHSLWGIAEPDIRYCKKISEEEITLALVPGLAFDANNYRLGYGKGFYDKLLPKLTAAVIIGVGFTEQKFKQLPIDSWDHPLQKIMLF